MALTNELIAAAWRSPSAAWALPLKAGPNHFDICRGQSYVSIKDQVIRARTLVRWLIDTGVVSNHTQRILVVGAGVAGVSAATSLIDWTRRTFDFTVDLIDRDDAPFGSQRGCTSRQLSLTQYDWPAPHSASHHYPDALTSYLGSGWRLPADAIVTQGGADTPDALAAQWEAELAAYSANTARLNSMYQHEMLGTPAPDPSGTQVSVTLRNHAARRHLFRNYDIVISAVGFGKERIPPWPAGGGIVTPYFWQNDNVADPHFAVNEKVAIVGLGDGSLQDFIRLVCDPALDTAHAVIDKMRAEYVAGGGNPAHWEAMLSESAAIDRQAVLAVPWAADPDPIWRRAHSACVRQVLGLVVANPVAATRAALAVLRTNLPNRIVFFSNSLVPTKVYLLNRFLYIALCMRLSGLVQHQLGRATLNPLSQQGAVHIDVQRRSRRVDTKGPFDHVIWRMGPSAGLDPAERGSVRDALGRVALAYAPPH